MDFEKAFDKVCHEILIEKLRAMSIAGGALTLLEIYLTERYQKVKIGSTESTALQVFSGVPQESVLGPLFINLFINYLPETRVSSCYGYADD